MSTREQTPTQVEDEVPSNSARDNAIAVDEKGKGKKRQMPLRSAVWQHFTRFKDTDGSLKGKCKYCGALYCCDSNKNGTNHLKYLMLSSVFNLKKAFDRFKELDDNFCLDFPQKEVGVHGSPSRSDWGSVSKIILFFEHFYDLTLKISGSTYVTSNTFFQEIYKLNVLLNEWSGSDDSELGIMALNMKEKFEKYWGDPKKMNKYIYVAAILDPRYKMDFLEFAFKNMYEETLRKEMKKDVHSFLMSLFNEYKKELAPESEVEVPSTPFLSLSEKDSNDPNLRGLAAIAGRMQMWKQKAAGGQSSKTEVEKYLSETVEEDVKGYDVLVWWKNNTARLPILSQVARDVLAIPVSTVASESCFSTGGRVLDSFQSSLTPKTVQSLICSQDWLRSSKDVICVEEDPQQLENLEKEFQTIALEPEVDL